MFVFLHFKESQSTIKAMLSDMKEANPTKWLEIQMGALRYKFDDYMAFFENGAPPLPSPAQKTSPPVFHLF
jgi:hypothetical protein